MLAGACVLDLLCLQFAHSLRLQKCRFGVRSVRPNRDNPRRPKSAFATARRVHRSVRRNPRVYPRGQRGRWWILVDADRPCAQRSDCYAMIFWMSAEPRGPVSGGGGGIRTHVTVSRKHAFQACAFSHSATPPYQLAQRRMPTAQTACAGGGSIFPAMRLSRQWRDRTGTVGRHYSRHDRSGKALAKRLIASGFNALAAGRPWWRRSGRDRRASCQAAVETTF
jgi:hypothetical protein